MADSLEPKGVIILRHEPDYNVLAKLFGWVLVMILFIVCLFYVSNMFNHNAKPCFRIAG